MQVHVHGQRKSLAWGAWHTRSGIDKIGHRVDKIKERAAHRKKHGFENVTYKARQR